MFDGNPGIPIGHQRLLVLANRLDSVNPNRFRITTWAIGQDPGLDETGQPACGTVCCACGLAAMMPEFADLGLTLVNTSDSDIWGDLWEVAFGNAKSWTAVEAFFDLTYSEAYEFFNQDSYPHRSRTKPAEVAARIREFVGAKVAAHV